MIMKVIFLLLSVWVQSALSQTTTVINNTCTVNNDLTTTIFQGLQLYFKANYEITKGLYQAGVNDVDQVLMPNPPADFFNSTTRQLLWSYYQPGNVYNVALFANNTYFRAGYSVNNGGVIYLYLRPPSNSSSTASCQYACNQNTGIVTNFTPSTCSPSNSRTHPSFVNALTSTGPTWAPPYNIPNAQSPSYLLGLSQQYNIGGSTSGNVGVVSNSIQLSNINTWLANLNGNPSVVLYLMQTSNSFLIASSVGVSGVIQNGVYQPATTSNNQIIASSAAYILSNNITQSTSQYYPALASVITVKYWGDNYGLAWTIVSVDCSTDTVQQYISTTTSTSTTSTTTTANDDDKINTVNSKVTGVLVILIIFVALYIIHTIYNLFQASKRDAAKASGIGSSIL